MSRTEVYDDNLTRPYQGIMIRRNGLGDKG
jgi:hypothetical protein